VPNNVWGWGILDALGAVQAATQNGIGILSGVVTDATTGGPLNGAAIALMQADNNLVLQTTTAPDGSYSQTLLAATYQVTATYYGFVPAIMPDIDVVSGTTTVLDLLLDPAPVWTLSGTVTEQGAGLPLRATLRVLDTPVAIDTDPATGSYITDIAEGSYNLRVESPGFQPQERAIDVQTDLVEDFILVPESTFMLRDSSRPCGPTFSWIDITGTGLAHSLGDDAFKYVGLGGGSFNYYGNTYSGLFVSSNGFISFGAGSSVPGGNAIPSAFPPNNAIYAFWDDLNPANGSQGTILTELVNGNLFIVEFYQVEHWPNGDPETFEIILDLETGSILLQYLTVSNTAWTSVGIENSDGSAGLSYAFHDPVVPDDTLVVQFYPIIGAFPAEQGLGGLEGTVIDGDSGEPVMNALVSTTGLTVGGAHVFSTDAAGYYSGTLCADWYTVSASAPGYLNGDVVPVGVYSGTQATQALSLQPANSYVFLSILFK
jgi:hypothetical protein